MMTANKCLLGLMVVATAILFDAAVLSAQCGDSLYRTSVAMCNGAVVWPLTVTARFGNPPNEVSDAHTYLGDSDVLQNKPQRGLPLTGASVGGTWCPMGEVTEVSLGNGWCMSVNVRIDPSGCEHIHIVCYPCPPERPLQ